MKIEEVPDKNALERTLREAGNNPVVCVFMSPRCGHCRRFMPFIESVCQEMPDVVFKKVDVTTSNELTKEFDINGVPQTCLFKNGVMHSQVTGDNRELLMNNLMVLRN